MKQQYRHTVREMMIHWFENQGEKEMCLMLQEKVEVKWCPESGKKYYFISAYGQIETTFNENTEVDRWYIKTGNCFPYTEEGKKQAEEYKQKLISLANTK